MVANNRLRASEQEIFALSMKVVAELEVKVGRTSGKSVRGQTKARVSLWLFGSGKLSNRVADAACCAGRYCVPGICVL